MQIGDKSLTTCQLHRIISGRLKYTSHASDHGEQIMIKVCNKMLNWFLEFGNCSIGRCTTVVENIKSMLCTTVVESIKSIWSCDFSTSHNLKAPTVIVAGKAPYFHMFNVCFLIMHSHVYNLCSQRN